MGRVGQHEVKSTRQGRNPLPSLASLFAKKGEESMKNSGESLNFCHIERSEISLNSKKKRFFAFFYKKAQNDNSRKALNLRLWRG